MEYFSYVTNPDKVRAQFVALITERRDPGEQAAITSEYQELLKRLAKEKQTVVWAEKEKPYEYKSEVEEKIASVATQTAALLPHNATLEAIGVWLWATFEGKPSEQTRGNLKTMGYRFNGTRKCWQWAPYKRRSFASKRGKAYLESKYGKRVIEAQA